MWLFNLFTNDCLFYCNVSLLAPLLTSSAVFLLFLYAVFDAVVLLVYVLVASDLAKHTPGLLGQPMLDQPARALRQEEESQELEHSREHRETQHVPGGGGKEGTRGVRQELFVWKALIAIHVLLSQQASDSFNL